MPSIAPYPKFQAFDDNGDPLVGGLLYTYIAGTTTKRATYSDADGTSNTNPVVLNARGEADVWLGSGAYKFVLKDADEVTIWTKDDITSIGGENDASSTGWTEHPVTNGQSATDLEGESFDLDDYSSADYDVEIVRGTTVIANGKLAVQDLNGTARVVLGGLLTEEAHGVTFSVSQLGTLVQLRAALDSGAGDGTIKLSRKLIPA